ncbi:DUF4142 domain-containing protein [Rufibacter sediminis]|uniref:DUF4142 domain-containing protein n=1 Tax=Rufibacter sediminis TaxID=2762756 RepID=A0ABR6VVD4_9BACT|nr:DUF4142 domain-containing protein [Rufibacter sediminis]MBC3540862.1 DUF4142 domain-containing protein [Rufibacter sediminis]
MKKRLYLIAALAVVAGSACSRIDANTSNSVPTTDAYEATVTATHAATGTAGTGTSGTAADAYVGTSSVAGAGTMRYGTRSITEATFLMEAASSGLMEVQLGKLALERSANSDVKKFAQMLVDHHSKANQELMSLASGMNVTLSTTLLPMHQELVDELSKLTGSAFDKKYIDKIEDVHESDIALYDVVSNGAQTTSVKAFAIRALPVLRIHEHEADKLESQVSQ